MSLNFFIILFILLFVPCGNILAFTVMRNPLIPKRSYLSQDYESSLYRSSTTTKFRHNNKEVYRNSKRLPVSNNPPESQCRCTCIFKPGPYQHVEGGRHSKEGISAKKWKEEMSKTVAYVGGHLKKPEDVETPPTQDESSSSSSSLSLSSSSPYIFPHFKSQRMEGLSMLENNEIDSPKDKSSEGQGQHDDTRVETRNNDSREFDENNEDVEDIEKYATSLDFSSLLQNNEVLDRYAGHWEETSRYPYRHLRDDICYRQPCKMDKDCCLHFNLCDKSAFICIDCWYGQNCKSEKDCCLRFPICSRKQTSKSLNSSAPQEPYIVSAMEGRCVDKLPTIDTQ